MKRRPATSLLDPENPKPSGTHGGGGARARAARKGAKKMSAASAPAPAASSEGAKPKAVLTPQRRAKLWAKIRVVTALCGAARAGADAAEAKRAAKAEVEAEVNDDERTVLLRKKTALQQLRDLLEEQPIARDSEATISSTSTEVPPPT